MLDVDVCSEDVGATRPFNDFRVRNTKARRRWSGNFAAVAPTVPPHTQSYIVGHRKMLRALVAKQRPLDRRDFDDWPQHHTANSPPTKFPLSVSLIA